MIQINATKNYIFEMVKDCNKHSPSILKRKNIMIFWEFASIPIIIVEMPEMILLIVCDHIYIWRTKTKKAHDYNLRTADNIDEKIAPACWSAVPQVGWRRWWQADSGDVTLDWRRWTGRHHTWSVYCYMLQVFWMTLQHLDLQNTFTLRNVCDALMLW